MKKKAYSKTVNEISGQRTFVNQTNDKNLPANTSKPSSGEQPYNNVENRERALRAPISLPDDKVKSVPQPYYQTPDESNDTKVPVRTLGKPGEPYGHPFGGPTRHPGRRVIQAGEEKESDRKEKYEPNTNYRYYPRRSQRQRKQRGKAKLYSKMWYKRNKEKHKKDNRLNYRYLKNRPDFKRKKEFRNSAKYGDKFERIDSGGERSPKERTQDWRKEKKRASMEEKTSRQRQKGRSQSAYQTSRQYYRKNRENILREARKKRQRGGFKQKRKRYQQKYQKNKNQYKRQGVKRYKRVKPRKKPTFRRRTFRKKRASMNFLFGIDLRSGFTMGFVKGVDVERWTVTVYVDGYGVDTLDINDFLRFAMFNEDRDLETFTNMLDRLCEKHHL